MWRWIDEVEDIMMRQNLLDEVAGIIFDSGPVTNLTAPMSARYGNQRLLSALS
jgi:hypothetical protein